MSLKHFKFIIFVVAAVFMASCSTTQQLLAPVVDEPVIVQEKTNKELMKEKLEYVINSSTDLAKAYLPNMLKYQKDNTREDIINHSILPEVEGATRDFCETALASFKDHSDDDEQKDKLDMDPLNIPHPDVKGEINKCFGEGLHVVASNSFQKMKRYVIYSVKTDSLEVSQLDSLSVDSMTVDILDKLRESILKFTEIRDRDAVDSVLVDPCKKIKEAGLSKEILKELENNQRRVNSRSNRQEVTIVNKNPVTPKPTRSLLDENIASYLTQAKSLIAGNNLNEAKAVLDKVINSKASDRIRLEAYDLMIDLYRTVVNKTTDSKTKSEREQTLQDYKYARDALR